MDSRTIGYLYIFGGVCSLCAFTLALALHDIGPACFFGVLVIVTGVAVWLLLSD